MRPCQAGSRWAKSLKHLMPSHRHLPQLVCLWLWAWLKTDTSAVNLLWRSSVV